MLLATLHPVRLAKTKGTRNVAVQAKPDKGFGPKSQRPQKKAIKTKEPADKNTTRLKKLQPKGFRPNPKNPDGSPAIPPAGLISADAPSDVNPADEIQFEEKLKSLQSTGSLLAKEKRLKTKGKPLEVDFLAGEAGPSYKNPPSLFNTITNRGPEDPDKVNPLGDNRVAVLIGTAILGAILIFSSVDMGGSDPMATKQAELTEPQKVELRSQRDKFEAQMKADSSDVEALEGAAVTYANLGDYVRAEQLLVKLSEKKSDDVDVWRLLGETRSKLKETGKAAAAFSLAAQLAGNDVSVLKDYTTALVADGRPGEAIAKLEALATQIKGNAVTDPNSIQPIEVDLLVGKVYTQWKGHSNEALGTYDKIIAEYPADFRGFLAKGVLLRQEGKRADADRQFLKARFLSPKELRGVVDKIAAPEN